jgi:hypothetical protein
MQSRQQTYPDCPTLTQRVSMPSLSSLAIQQMLLEEKLRVMEELWESLTADASKLESAAWDGDVLRETEQRYEAGQEHPVD